MPMQQQHLRRQQQLQQQQQQQLQQQQRQKNRKRLAAKNLLLPNASCKLFWLLLLLSNGFGQHSVQALPLGSTASGGLTVIEAAATSSRWNSGALSIAGSSLFNILSTTAPVLERKRHRKRNSNWIDYRNYNENSTRLEWFNPCDGNYAPPRSTLQKRRRTPLKEILNRLRGLVNTEITELKSRNNAINISNMEIWSLHRPNYEFLPKLKPNSTIALKRWYRKMQTYVASFAFLRRNQVNNDRRNLKGETPTSEELKELLLSSRSMLCELESAVNKTYPALSPLSASSQAVLAAQQRRALPQISRNDMNKRLKLFFKHAEGGDKGKDLSIIDLKFVKQYYYKFLRIMVKLLRSNSTGKGAQRQEQRPRHRAGQQRSQRQRRRRQQQKQQKQQLTQQRNSSGSSSKNNKKKQVLLQLSLDAVNRKEFNEVSKPLNPLGNGGGRGRGKRQQPLAASTTPMHQATQTTQPKRHSSSSSSSSSSSTRVNSSVSSSVGSGSSSAVSEQSVLST